MDMSITIMRDTNEENHDRMAQALKALYLQFIDSESTLDYPGLKKIFGNGQQGVEIDIKDLPDNVRYIKVINAY